MLLGRAIREARGGLTQDDLAAKLGTDQPTVSKWERDKLRPTLEDIRAVEDATGNPKGFVLIRAGLVDVDTDVQAAILADPKLKEQDRATLLRIYRLSVGQP